MIPLRELGDSLLVVYLVSYYPDKRTPDSLSFSNMMCDHKCVALGYSRMSQLGEVTVTA